MITNLGFTVSFHVYLYVFKMIVKGKVFPLQI